MSKFSTTFIEKHIANAISMNPAVDVYRLAKEIHADYPDTDFEALAELITQTVITTHGCAVWDRTSSSRS